MRTRATDSAIHFIATCICIYGHFVLQCWRKKGKLICAVVNTECGCVVLWLQWLSGICKIIAGNLGRLFRLLVRRYFFYEYKFWKHEIHTISIVGYFFSKILHIVTLTYSSSSACRWVLNQNSISEPFISLAFKYVFSFKYNSKLTISNW